MKNPLESAKLTKNFFMSVPEGLFLVSNVGLTPTQPMFAETVQPVVRREVQWKQIVACRANNRLCHLFKTPEDYLEFRSIATCRWERN